MKLIPNNLRLHIAQQFIESFSETANTIYYMFVGKHTSFNDDTNPPTPVDSFDETLYQAFKDMLYGKQITSNDIVLIINKSVWAAGTVYDQYEHDIDLSTKNFFVATSGAGGGYDVFKCLSNNNGAASTYYPRLSETAADDAIYETSDGYQWKYMFSITGSQWTKFSTDTFMPVYTNTNVSANAINGSIDYVQVLSGGSGYNMFAQGTVQAVSTIGIDQYITIETTSSSTVDFYQGCAIKVGNELRTVAEYLVSGSLRRVKVDTPFTTTPTTSDTYYISPLISVAGSCDSDGSGFLARALVNSSSSNSIYKVEIVDRGQNYSFANVVAIGGITSVSNTATFKAMISPKNGHGFEPATELFSKSCIASVKFDSTTSSGKVLDQNDFRVVGILQDPVFANVVITISSSTGSFSLGESVSGANSNAVGTVVTANSSQVKLTNVTGFFAASETLTGNTSAETATVVSTTQPTTYFDQTYKLTIDNVSGTFQEDEEVYQGPYSVLKTANAAHYYSNSSIMRVSNVKGAFNVSDDLAGVVETVYGHTSSASAKVTGIIGKDLVDYGGEIIYIENMSPINKNTSQTETVKIILQF